MSTTLARDEAQVTEPEGRGRLLDVVGTLARLVLALVLLVAGFLKLRHGIVENGRSVMAYQLFDWQVAKIIGTVLPSLEIALGIFLLLGLLTRGAAVLTAVLWVIFITGIVSAWARGLQIDCGCFGKGGPLAPGEKPQYLSEVLRDIGLLLCSLWLIWRPRTLLSLDRALRR